MTTRVYVPSTRALLAAWHAAEAVPADADRVLAPADDEESEYDALMTAADLAAALSPVDGRRVVVVAEVVADGAGPLSVHDWVAVHCDVDARPPDSDPDADADPDEGIAWFGVQEIPDLI